MLVIGTWSFSLEAVKNAFGHMKSSADSVTSVEKGINIIESDEKYGLCIVGKGGPRNVDGYLEMDAAIMEGPSHKFGAVTALKGISTPISVARCVMRKSPHSMLSGNGALKFATDNGFQIDDMLLNPSCDTQMEPNRIKNAHDTLGLIATYADGCKIAVGVSTSGMPRKHSGRVGDSALPGSGLYANEFGAACCSGDGDEILKFCPAFHAVHFMSSGMTPLQACEEVVDSIKAKTGNTIEIGMIAANVKGEYGASTTVKSWTDPMTGAVYQGFPYVIMTSKQQQPVIELAKAKS